MATTPVTQLYDKTIFANKSTPLYRDASLVLANGKKQVPYKTAEKGDTIGVVYSHIANKDGIWLMFLEPKALGGRSYYMLYNKANVDTTSLKQQGVKTDQQIDKEQADKELYEKSKFEYYIKKYGIWVLLTIIAVPVVKTYVQKKF